MKYFRIIAIICCFVLLNMISSKNIYSCPSADDACYNNGDCLIPGNWYEMTDQVVILPEYPNCLIFVTYCYRTCLQSHTTQYYIETISFYPFGCYSCDGLFSSIWPNFKSGDYSVVNADAYSLFYGEIFEQITQDEFTDFYNYLSDDGKADFDCATGKYSAKFIEFHATCASICTYMTSENGSKKMVTKSNSCISTEQCCGLEERYCYNSQTKEIQRTEIMHWDNQINCSNITPPNCDPPPGALDYWSSSCISRCNSPQGQKTVTPINDNKIIQNSLLSAVYVSIFPNPASNKITISTINSNVLFNKWVIYDNMGQVINSNTLSKPLLNFEISLDNINIGVYYIALYSNNEVYYNKIIKNE